MWIFDNAIIGALIASLGGTTLVWAGSVARRDASLIDRFWGLGFVGLAWLYWWNAGGGRVTVPILVTLWGVRLSLHLIWRNWGRGEDYRYRAMRARGGPRFPWKSLVTIHWLQGVLLWFISIVLFGAIKPSAVPSAPLVGLGSFLWVIGFGFESIGDWQLARFKANPANRGRVLDQGLWRYTRHPNYFGDCCVWWAFYCFAGAVGAWWTIGSPIVMTALLIKVSGVALLERRLVSAKPGYAGYVARTNAFVPGPPRKH